MATSALSEPSPTGGCRSIPALVAALALHTAAVYICAPEVSVWLIGHWISWIERPLTHATAIPFADWHLQHFVVLAIFPAAILGYVRVMRLLPSTLRERIGPSCADGAASWSWTIPTVVLVFRLLLYHAQPPSVLYGSSVSAIKYFFDIQEIVPTWMHPLGNDPVRALAQLWVTGPFYAGLGYSVSALAQRHRLGKRLFSFERDEEPAPTEP